MKYSIDDIRREYDRLDCVCGVNSNIIEIRLNNATRRLGCFTVKQEPKKRLFEPRRYSLSITISRHVMDDDRLFYDTIRHEYAHAVVYLRNPKEHHAHDAVWKAVCREIGCTPRATVKNDEVSRQREEQSKYTVVCNSCGASTHYLRAGKIVSQLKRNPKTALITCRKCGGRIFTLIENR